MRRKGRNGACQHDGEARSGAKEEPDAMHVHAGKCKVVSKQAAGQGNVTTTRTRTHTTRMGGGGGGERKGTEG